MGGPLDVFYGAAKQATYDFADFLTSPFPNSTARDLLPYLLPNSRLQQNGAAAVGLATAATMIPEEGFAILPR